MEIRGKGRVGILWDSLILNLTKALKRSEHQIIVSYSVRENISVIYRFAKSSFGKALGFLSVNLVYFERFNSGF